MKRVIAGLTALATSGVAGVGFAWLARDQAGVVTPEQLAASHEAEEALAVAAGLERLDFGSTEELPFEREVPLEAGQCVAIVASLAGPDALLAVRVRLPTGRSADAMGSPGRVAHEAICTHEASTASILVEPAPRSAPYAPRSLRFSLFRGVPTHQREYTRLDTTFVERAEVDERAVRSRLAAWPARELAPAIEVPREHAAVLPASSATFAALRALTGRTGAAPAIEPSLAAQDPFRAPTDLAIPPRVITSGGAARALVAIDTGALAASSGSACVEVLIARLDDPSVAVPITRIALPSRAEDELARVDAAIARDTVCAHGLYVYTTDERSGGVHVVSVRVADGTGTAPPLASTFGSDRRGAPLLAVQPAPIVEATRAECTSGTATACDRWVSFVAMGLDGAGTLAEPLSRQCELAGGDACDRLATLREAEGDATAADAAELRACETGSEPACLRRAARFRDAGRFGEAYAVYRTGCTHGSSAACAAVAAMEEWQLTSG
jgi:hypothetical protein